MKLAVLLERERNSFATAVYFHFATGCHCCIFLIAFWVLGASYVLLYRANEQNWTFGAGTLFYLDY